MERKIANKKVAWTGTVQIIVATNLMMTRIDHVRYEVNLDMTIIHKFINKMFPISAISKYVFQYCTTLSTKDIVQLDGKGQTQNNQTF